jgi:hypothetical protein
MDGKSYLFPRYLQSLYYISGWNSLIFRDHAVNGIVFSSDHKWPSLTVFVFIADMSCLKLSNTIFNCHLGRTFFT